METDIVQGSIDKVTESEVVRTIKTMKLGKAAGVSEFAAEDVIASGKIGVEC